MRVSPRAYVAAAAALGAALLAVVPATPSEAAGAIIYVDQAATSGADNGTSWADAFLDVQSALAVASDGDDILVAEGSYTPHPTDATVSFTMLTGVHLFGGYATGGVAGPDPSAYPTILSGDLNGDDLPGGVNTGENSLSLIDGGRRGVFSVHDIVVDGFTITGAIDSGVNLEWTTMTVANAQIVENAGFRGAGIYQREASVTLLDSRVAENSASAIGGGISVVEGRLTITDSLIESNTTTGGGGGIYYFGDAADLTLTRSVVSKNTAGLDGGGIIVSDLSDAFLIDSVISDNVAGGDGGGIDAEEETNLVNTLVTGNSAGGHGGGVFVEENTTLVNSLVTGNHADLRGGGLHNVDDLWLFNTVVADNTAAGGGGQLDNVGRAASVVNSILWDASGPGITDDPSSTTTVDHSDVKGWVGPGVGNIDVDPLFVGGGDYRLQAQSPARERGDDAAVPADTFDVDGDSDTAEPTPDLDLADRIMGAVDMGAYETPVPWIRPFGVVVAEGDAGSATASVVVFLEDADGDPWVPAEPVTVDWLTFDTPHPNVAQHGSDIVAGAGELTFAVGQSQSSVPVEVLGDTQPEPPLLYGEWGLVAFGNPSANARIDPAFFGLGLVIIVDDD